MKTTKIGSLVKYYDVHNRMRYGFIERIEEGCYLIRKYDDYRVSRVPNRDIIKIYNSIKRVMFNSLLFIFALMLVGLVSFSVYLIATDTTSIVVEENAWMKCNHDARILYEQFNDTVASGYGGADNPSLEVQNFIDKCLEKSGY